MSRTPRNWPRQSGMSLPGELHSITCQGRSMSGVTPEQARDFYIAAARFYRQAPWRSVGSDEPIRVECEQLGGGPRFAIVLGKKGMTRGLWLCDDWKTCFLLEQGDYKAVADHLQYTALHYGGKSQINPDDLERAERLGF